MLTKRDSELRSKLFCYLTHAFTDRCLVRGCVWPPVTLSSPITDHEKSQFLAVDKCYTQKQWGKNLSGGHDEMNTSYQNISLKCQSSPTLSLIPRV